MFATAVIGDSNAAANAVTAFANHSILANTFIPGGPRHLQNTTCQNTNNRGKNDLLILAFLSPVNTFYWKILTGTQLTRKPVRYSLWVSSPWKYRRKRKKQSMVEVQKTKTGICSIHAKFWCLYPSDCCIYLNEHNMGWSKRLWTSIYC